jgi:hypothetical protein
MLASCSGFEHIHYRKLKKVPAKGDAGERAFHERTVYFQEKKNDSAAVLNFPVKKAMEDSARPLYNKYAYQFTSSRKTRPALTAGIHINKHGYKLPAFPEKLKRPVKSPDRRGDGSVFLVLLFLFIGFGLLATGVVMIIIGINSIVWWLILLGLVVLFLGLIPFLGLISLAFGDRYRPVPAYDESQKKSVFPDHQ